MTIALTMAAFVLSWLGVRWLARPGNRWSAPAEVNERSLHEKVTPQGGGLAVMLVILLGGLIGHAEHGRSLLGGGLVLAGVALISVVSFIDDRKPLPSRLRFLVHCAGAVLVLGAGVAPESIALPFLPILHLPSWLAWILAVPALVWFTNLYNFMDGMDGFAGGMTVLGFSAFGMMGLQAGDSEFAASAFLVAGAAGGFLIWNFPPAKIFLGDVGAAPLGLLAGAMTLWGVHRGVYHLPTPLLVFAPFWVDATVTLLRRLLNGERIWEAHRSHVYQRLASSGWGHRRTTLWEYAAMVAFAGAGFAYEVVADAGRLMVLSVAILVAIAVFRFAAIRRPA